MDTAVDAGRLAPSGTASERITGEAIAHVLRTDGIRLVAQPIVALEPASIAGYELLARFTSPVRATPDRWFRAARTAGLAVDLTVAVFEQLHELRPTLPPNTFCTVNVEPDLLLDPDVWAALTAAGDLSRVVVELTEHDPLDDLEALTAVLDRVRTAGGTVAVDDAGTGYAGLARLLAVRPDLVKLDRELISGIDTDPVRRALVELVGSLAGRMDAWVIAEGVETRDECAVLANLGIPLAQGWYFARPEEPWAAIEPSRLAGLRALAARNDLGRHVAALVRARPVRRDGESDLAVDDVVVDRLDRPVAVVVRESGGPATVPAMCVAPSSDPRDVLRRAMARPPGRRDAPIACTDPRGRLIGVIDVAELVEAALANVDQL